MIEYVRVMLVRTYHSIYKGSSLPPLRTPVYRCLTARRVGLDVPPTPAAAGRAEADETTHSQTSSQAGDETSRD